MGSWRSSLRLDGMANFHSEDYDLGESDLHRELLLSTTDRQYALEQFMAWFISVLIGQCLLVRDLAFALCCPESR